MSKQHGTQLESTVTAAATPAIPTPATPTAIPTATASTGQLLAACVYFVDPALPLGEAAALRRLLALHGAVDSATLALPAAHGAELAANAQLAAAPLLGYHAGQVRAKWHPRFDPARTTHVFCRDLLLPEFDVPGAALDVDHADARQPFFVLPEWAHSVARRGVHPPHSELDFMPRPCTSQQLAALLRRRLHLVHGADADSALRHAGHILPLAFPMLFAGVVAAIHRMSDESASIVRQTVAALGGCIVAAPGGCAVVTLVDDATTHLVVPSRRSKQCQAASARCSVAVVSHLWLEESVREMRVLAATAPRFTYFPSDVAVLVSIVGSECTVGLDALDAFIRSKIKKPAVPSEPAVAAAARHPSITNASVESADSVESAGSVNSVGSVDDSHETDRHSMQPSAALSGILASLRLSESAYTRAAGLKRTRTGTGTLSAAASSIQPRTTPSLPRNTPSLPRIDSLASFTLNTPLPRETGSTSASASASASASVSTTATTAAATATTPVSVELTAAKRARPAPSEHDAATPFRRVPSRRVPRGGSVARMQSVLSATDVDVDEDSSPLTARVSSR
ncbi:hypothetical protein GQ42DRAFT_177297 [Ramicandelaber brevisporus]|nr:hypothetical protein GQ42DRAFT_177297 [Ramicandelaber brevisporus]